MLQSFLTPFLFGRLTALQYAYNANCIPLRAFLAEIKPLLPSCLPRLARPISRRKLVFCGIAIMSRPKVTSAPRLVLFNRHVGVTKTNKLYFTAFFRQYRAFLGLSGRFFRLVIARKRFTTIF